MKLRRFTSAGVEMARQYLAAVKEANNVDAVTLNGQPFTRAALISSSAYSDAIPALADLELDETRTFDTTFAFCEYFDSLIHDHNPQAYREDVGFWTWLAFVYLPQLVKTKGGKVSVGAAERVIFEGQNFNRAYRHLLALAFYLYQNFNGKPMLCNVALCHPLNSVGDLPDKIMANQTVMQNPAIMAALNRLYFDDNLMSPKKGSGGERPGAIRRFLAVLDQISLTRDLFEESDGAMLMSLLPNEFNRFKNLP
jgi:hypothetical protein